TPPRRSGRLSGGGPGEGRARRRCREPADPAGRLGAQQGRLDGLPLRDARRQPRAALRGRSPDDHRRRRQTGEGGRARGGDRRPARAEGLQTEDRVERARRDHRRVRDPRLHLGTVVAMLLPILTAICALLSTLAIIRILGHAITVPTVAPTLATMIGLGVGIDYALFIVTRYFRWVSTGLSREESVARAAATSGGA